jgi:hypothetical protein
VLGTSNGASLNGIGIGIRLTASALFMGMESFNGKPKATAF